MLAVDDQFNEGITLYCMGKVVVNHMLTKKVTRIDNKVIGNMAQDDWPLSYAPRDKQKL